MIMFEEPKKITLQEIIDEGKKELGITQKSKSFLPSSKRKRNSTLRIKKKTIKRKR